MKIQIRERDRRALLGLGLAVGLYLVVAELALPAYDQLKAGSEDVIQKEDQLRKYRRALERKGSHEQLLEQARKQMAEAEARLVRGDNASLASSELQSLVESTAMTVGIGLSQRSMSAARKKDNFFNEITMTLAFDCTPNQLVRFLGDLRAAPKQLAVRSMQVAPVQVAQAPPTAGEFQKTVRVNITIGAVLASPAIAGTTAPGTGD